MRCQSQDAHEESPIPVLNRFLALRIVYGNGLRAHRVSDEKRVLPSHDVCQVQDSCVLQGVQAVKSGTGSLQAHAPVPPVSSISGYNLIFTHSLCLSMVIPVQFSGILSRVCLDFRLDLLFSIQTLAGLEPRQHVERIISQGTRNFFGLSDSLSFVARHTNSLDFLSLPHLANTHTKFGGLSLVHLRVKPPRGRGTTAPRSCTPPSVTVKTHASLRLGSRRASAVPVDVIACVCLHAVFFTHQRSRLAKTTIFNTTMWNKDDMGHGSTVTQPL